MIFVGATQNMYQSCQWYQASGAAVRITDSAPDRSDTTDTYFQSVLQKSFLLSKVSRNQLGL